MRHIQLNTSGTIRRAIFMSILFLTSQYNWAQDSTSESFESYDHKYSLIIQSGVFSDNYLQGSEQASVISSGIPLMFGFQWNHKTSMMLNLDLPEYISGGFYLNRSPVSFRTQGTKLSNFSLWGIGIRASASIPALLNDVLKDKFYIIKGGDIYVGAHVGYEYFNGILSITSTGRATRLFTFPFLGVSIDTSQHLKVCMELGKTAQSFLSFGCIYEFGKTQSHEN